MCRSSAGILLETAIRRSAITPVSGAVMTVAMPARLRRRGVAHVERIGVAESPQTGRACQALLVGVEAAVAVSIGDVVSLYAEGSLARLSRDTRESRCGTQNKGREKRRSHLSLRVGRIATVIRI
jgi:hypothetical protein